jgi:hypothetical protein
MLEVKKPYTFLRGAVIVFIVRVHSRPTFRHGFALMKRNCLSSSHVFSCNFHAFLFKAASPRKDIAPFACDPACQVLR